MLSLTGLDVDTTYAAHVLPRAARHWASASAWSWRPRWPAPPPASRAADAGVASAMVNTSQQVGGSIGTGC